MSKKAVSRYVVANGAKPINSIKNIIAVASGKGGVGKSTVALNLALALKTLGANVGLLDADIYGPSLPLMVGAATKPVIRADQKMEPIMAFGLQTMSIGYLIDANTPAVWRGPMVSGALMQMLNNTAWQTLDYLVIDLPPGTGDVQLTLAQKVPVCGAVIVTTPQDVALIDVEKAIAMFNRVNVPIFGVVENMSVHICSNCGHQDPVFGANGGEILSTKHNVALLGKLPLATNICTLADQGKPIVALYPEDPISAAFFVIANNLGLQLTKLQRDLSLPATNIVIE